MQNLNALRDEVFAINKANGWHEQERSFGELIALVHSEVSEALEDFRNKKAVNEVWYEYKSKEYNFESVVSEWQKPSGVWVLGKPCGIPSELADIIIRILDICGLYGWDLEAEYDSEYICDDGIAFGKHVAGLHYSLSLAYEAEEDERPYTASILYGVISKIERLCVEYSIDLESIIRQKLEYNKTRGYKHGGKLI